MYRRDGRGRRQTNREKFRPRSKNPAGREYAKDTEIKRKSNIIGESGIRVGVMREREKDGKQTGREREGGERKKDVQKTISREAALVISNRLFSNSNSNSRQQTDSKIWEDGKKRKERGLHEEGLVMRDAWGRGMQGGCQYSIIQRCTRV